MKNILMIAYHFYPDLAIGAQRTNKYAKYLPEHGWQPYILTVDQSKIERTDNSTPEFDCPLFRASQWPVPDDIYLKLKDLLRKKSTSLESKEIKPQITASNSKRSKNSFIKKLAYTISTTPDHAVGWCIPAVMTAKKIISENKIDLIYTSGPPQTCHLTGYIVSKLTGLPLVLDFRDPWFYEKRHYKNGLSLTEHFDRYFEKKAVMHASLIITTCNEWRDGLIERYQPHLDNKCHSIINGFDLDDFKSTPTSDKREQSTKQTFLYAGSLYSGRNPKNLLIALGELLKEKQCSPNKIHFNFYGDIEIDMDEIRKIIADYQLGDVVSFFKPVKRASYLQLLADADALIMFQSNEARVNIPGKAFEYLAVGNDILCLTSEGATKNFMSSYEHVAIASLDNTQQIKEAIKKIVKRFNSESDSKKQSLDLTSITKKHLTGKFAGLLTALADKQ